jgi:hypothetical protein
MSGEGQIVPCVYYSVNSVLSLFRPIAICEQNQRTYLTFLLLSLRSAAAAFKVERREETTKDDNYSWPEYKEAKNMFFSPRTKAEENRELYKIADQSFLFVRIQLGEHCYIPFLFEYGCTCTCTE